MFYFDSKDLILTIIALLFGWFFSWYYYYRSLKNKTIVLSLLKFLRLSNDIQSLYNDLSVTLNQNPIDPNLYHIGIRLENSSGRDISNSDLNNPLVIKFPPNTQLLDVSVSKSSQLVNPIIQNFNNDKIDINLDFLKNKSFVELGCLIIPPPDLPDIWSFFNLMAIEDKLINVSPIKQSIETLNEWLFDKKIAYKTLRIALMFSITLSIMSAMGTWGQFLKYSVYFQKVDKPELIYKIEARNDSTVILKENLLSDRIRVNIKDINDNKKYRIITRREPLTLLLHYFFTLLFPFAILFIVFSFVYLPLALKELSNNYSSLKSSEI